MSEEVQGSDLVPTTPAEGTHTGEVDEVKLATKNLVDAVQRLAKAKAASAKDLGEDAHENIDRFVQEARTKAGEKLQTVTKEVGSLEDKLTKAAKAAWDIISAPNPKD
jgi:ElaB/YqjD/DUF883 family membrane-anchored ribosome-binding protein